MFTYRRAVLTSLIILTTCLIGFQLYLILTPVTFDPEGRYVRLVDQYRVTKMERLVLEEQYALAKTKKKVLTLAALLQRNDSHELLALNKESNKQEFLTAPPAVTSPLVSNRQNIALSLEEAKTFEQLEAYVSNNNPNQSQPLTVDEKNLLSLPSSDFTLQLMGVRDMKELTRFVKENQLQNARIFHTYYLNKDWYVLVFGNYQNHTEALKTIETLPSNIQQLKPWIRQLATIHKAIQQFR